MLLKSSGGGAGGEAGQGERAARAKGRRHLGNASRRGGGGGGGVPAAAPGGWGVPGPLRLARLPLAASGSGKISLRGSIGGCRGGVGLLSGRLSTSRVFRLRGVCLPRRERV